MLQRCNHFCAYDWPLWVLYILLWRTFWPSCVVLWGPGVRPVVVSVSICTCVVWSGSGSVLSWWSVWYTVHVVVWWCPWLPWKVLVAAATAAWYMYSCYYNWIAEAGTVACIRGELWGPLAMNGFFITSRSCQLKELVAQQRRYVCGQVLWSHDSVCHRSAVVSLPPPHVRWIAEPRHRTTDPHPTATSPPLSLLQ